MSHYIFPWCIFSSADSARDEGDERHLPVPAHAGRRGSFAAFVRSKHMKRLHRYLSSFSAVHADLQQTGEDGFGGLGHGDPEHEETKRSYPGRVQASRLARLHPVPPDARSVPGASRRVVCPPLEYIFPSSATTLCAARDDRGEQRYRVPCSPRHGEQSSPRVRPSLEGTRSCSVPSLVVVFCARADLFAYASHAQGIVANIALLVHEDDVMTIIKEDRTLVGLHSYTTG